MRVQVAMFTFMDVNQTQIPMKYHIQNLTLLSAVIAFAGCNSAKTDSKPETEITTEATVSQTDTLKTTEEPAVETKVVEGTVKEITTGKDGYTAQIEAANKEVYFVTISHSNLKDHTQYKSVKAGETLKVSGDSWKMGDENHITVREIQ